MIFRTLAASSPGCQCTKSSKTQTGTPVVCAIGCLQHGVRTSPWWSIVRFCQVRLVDGSGLLAACIRVFILELAAYPYFRCCTSKHCTKICYDGPTEVAGICIIELGTCGMRALAAAPRTLLWRCLH
eukprot:839743-Amphidinium_carterae.1